MKKLLLLSILCILSISLIAQTWTTYTTSNTSTQLSNNIVNAVAIDGDGVKWFGTSDGLTAFDGNNWKTYTTDYGLPSNYVTSIAIDAESGTMWIGTDKGLAAVNGADWMKFLIGKHITAVVIDGSNGNKWIATNSDGVYKFDGVNWTNYNNENTGGYLSNNVTSIAIGQNLIWFGNYLYGITRFDGTEWTNYDISDKGFLTNYNMVLSLAAESIDVFGDGTTIQNIVWIGTSGGGVLKYDDYGGNGTWNNYYTDGAHMIAGNVIYAINKDANGLYWFGTDGGITKFDVEMGNTSYTTDNGLLSNDIDAIAFEGSDVWIGTGVFGIRGAGAAKFNGDNWENFPMTDGLQSNDITCMNFDLQNHKWFGFGTYGFGVTEFDGTKWINYRSDGSGEGLIDNNVNCILVDGLGNKWFGTDNGISVFDGTNWKGYSTTNDDPISNNHINSMAIDKEGAVWFATQDGLSEYDGSTWHTFYFEINNVTSVTVDASDNIWVGFGGGGAAKYDRTTWTNFMGNNELGSNFVHSVKAEGSNNVWFAFGSAGNGLTKYNGTIWTTFNHDNGLISDFVNCVASEAVDIKWIGTLYGVSKFQGTTWTSITENDGLAGNLIYDIAIDKDDNKWFGTNKGVSVLDDKILKVSQTALNVSCTNNSTASFDITSNINWTLSSNQSWLALSNSSGSGLGSITVTAAFNTGEAPRTAIITASGTGVASKTVTITQEATLLTVSATTLEMAVSNNSTASFTIASNIGWTVNSDKTWLTLSNASGTNNGTITVTGLVNASEDSRTATVTVTGNGISKTVTITQAASVLTLSHSALDIAATASSTASFSISSNIGWSAASDQTWLTLSGLSGINNADITITASANTDNVTRTATITISGTGVTSKTITVTQAASVPTGFKEISDPGIILYPMPVIDKLNISIAEPVSKTSITLYNRGGIVIFTSTSTEGITELNMSQYASGVYYIKIVTSDDKMSIRKIIKR